MLFWALLASGQVNQQAIGRRGTWLMQNSKILHHPENS